MKIKIKLDDGAFAPESAHAADAGYDLFATRDFVVPKTSAETAGYDGWYVGSAAIGYAIHDTGVHVEIPEGYVGFLKSKSGLNVKFGLTGEGVIDSGYTGSIVAKLYNHTAKDVVFKRGDKIIQLVLLPIIKPDIEIVDSLEETERGDNGFGSSGK